MKKYKLTCLLIGVCFGLQAQEILTVQKAIEIAVEKNYDVRIAKNNSSISEVEKSTLNSGYLPRVSLSSGVNYSDESQNVTFSEGDPINISGAVTESYNASITAEYTLFDGFERKFTNLKNKENFNLKKIEEKQSIENTIVSIYQMYYDVAFQSEVVKNLALNVANSRDRLDRAKRRTKFGQGTKLDELNAQVDLNNDSISYATSLKDLNNLKRKLNLLLGRKIEETYEIDTLVQFSEMLSVEDIIASSEENNVSSLLRKQNLLLSDLEISINKAKFLPKVSGSAGYRWAESINPPTNFLATNESYGVNLGLNLTWNIFDGGRSKTQVKTAKIRKENRAIELLQAKEQLKSDVLNAYDDYKNKLFKLQAEAQNVALNELSFSRTQKQFSLGQINSLEFRQTQINKLNALNNYARAKYDLKIAEINLKQLSGKLVE
jgi:outer membrane protein TolC